MPRDKRTAAAVALVTAVVLLSGCGACTNLRAPTVPPLPTSLPTEQQTQGSQGGNATATPAASSQAPSGHTITASWGGDPPYHGFTMLTQAPIRRVYGNLTAQASHNFSDDEGSDGMCTGSDLWTLDGQENGDGTFTAEMHYQTIGATQRWRLIYNLDGTLTGTIKGDQVTGRATMHGTLVQEYSGPNPMPPDKTVYDLVWTMNGTITE